MRTLLFALACLASTARRIHRTTTQTRGISFFERRTESSPYFQLLTDFNYVLSRCQLQPAGLLAPLKSLAINFLAFNNPVSGLSVTDPSCNVVAGKFIHVKLQACIDGLPALDNKASTSAKLMLNSAAAVVPHPEKTDHRYDLEPHCGGEDAFFINDAAGILGVADGVGGWSCRGVDPGIFSRQLMRFAAEEARQGNDDPHDVLQQAHAKTTALGSSTALILSLVSKSAKRATPRINAANLGDSGFLIVRNGKVLFQSEPQQHSFNLPFQLAMPDLTGVDGDDPRQAQKIIIENIEEGDLLILGTDGLFDNAFANEIAEIARHAEEAEGTKFLPKAIAEELARQTSLWALDEQRKSPFEEEAAQEGTLSPGGKLDDITVVVAQVVRSPGADDSIVAKR